MNIGVRAQSLMYWGAHVGIWMNRIYNLNIVTRRNPNQGFAYVGNAGAQILAPMPGNKY